MRKKSCMTTLSALVFAVLAPVFPAHACTWAVYANGGAAVLVRTMDWTREDPAVVKGHGRNIRVRAADTPDALEYDTKYASIQIHSFGDHDVVGEAMNEVGLQGAILFLDESELPARQPGRPDVDPNNFVAYAVSSFATVREVLDSLERINFSPAQLRVPGMGVPPLVYPDENCPLHFAFADPSGDKAVVEFVGGVAKVYHGPDHDALTNEPSYDLHRAIEDLEYVPNGSIATIDRRLRARLYMRDMRERGVTTSPRALLAMRGLLASVTAGSEEIDRLDDSVYPTIWGVLGDLNARKYYLIRTDSWCWEQYDFSLFDGDRPEVTVLGTAACPYGKIEVKAAQ